MEMIDNFLFREISVKRKHTAIIPGRQYWKGFFGFFFFSSGLPG
jgi:hypothetical protein